MRKLIPLGVIVAILSLVPIAYATNESSYRWGYSQAVVEHNCNVKQGNECMDDVGMNDVCEDANSSANTNSTACKDGWADAWAHIGHETRAQALCEADLKYCPTQSD